MRDSAFAHCHPRKRSLPLILCASAAALIATAQSPAASFTYTPTNSDTDIWSAGSNWSATPISAADTQLTFVENNTTVLPDGLTNTSTNNITGQFQLNILNLQGTGPASGAATININGVAPSTGLNLTSNGATTPVVNLNALAGATGLTYNVNPLVTLSSNTLFSGSGTAAFKFNGGIDGGTVSVFKTGASTLTLGGNSILGSLNLGVNTAGGKITVGSAGSLSVGLGSGNLSVGVTTVGTAANGTLDASAASFFSVNVATVAVGSTGNNGVTGVGVLNLAASTDITASTSFLIGNSSGAFNATNTNPFNGNVSTVTTAPDGFSTIRTPILTIGGNKSNGQFTLGAGSTLQVTGITGTNNGRTALTVGSTTSGGGSGAWTGTADFSAGIFNGTLSSLVIGNRTVTSSTATEVGTMILGNNDFNHLDVNGSSESLGGVVVIGRATGATGSSGSATGTLTIGNLDFTSQIVSSNNGTAILIGASSATAPITGTGTLNLNGGTLGITTTGSAISGSTGTSTVNFNGTTLRAGASSTDWITGLTTANVAAGGARFDTNGFNVTIPQNFTGEGTLTKLGNGQLTLSGTNSYTGRTFVEGGLLFLAKTDALPNFATPGQLSVADGAGLGVNIGGTGGFTLAQLETLRSNGTFVSSVHNLAIGTANAGGDVIYTSSFATIGSFSKLGANKLTLDNNPTILGSLNVGFDNDGGTLAADSGAPFSVGSGALDNINIGVVTGGANGSGILDVSAASSFTANVGSIKMGATTGNGFPTSSLLLPANSNITAATQFLIGDSNNANPGTRTNTVTTGTGGLTAIQTPNLTIGGRKSHGSFTLGNGNTLELTGLFGERAALNVGNYTNVFGGSGEWTGTADFSAGIFKGYLSSLVIGHLDNENGNGSETATLTLSNNPANHLDISGVGPVVVIGRYVRGLSGSGTGTLTIGNLDETSSIVSIDDSTAILLGTGGTGTQSNGTLNLNGGTLTITTAGLAIEGGTGTSTVNFNGTTLKAGSSSANWINGITNANVSTGGAKFDTNGNDITIAQVLGHDAALAGADGGLTKSGNGTLNLTGANTYTGATTVNGGTLLVSGSLSGTSLVAVNNPGTKLQLGANDVLDDATNLSLSNSTLETLGFSDTLGTLTLEGTVTIDLGGGSSFLRFAGSELATWSGTLSIINWSGLTSGSGSDRLFFGSGLGGLTDDQIARIDFINPEGFAPGIYDAQILPSGELVAAVPEPGTVALLMGGIGALAMRRRRRM